MTRRGISATGQNTFSAVWWDFLIPRLRFGGAVNLGGRTRFIYADALFSIPLWDRWFA
jgi:hypothetical protein